MSTEAPVTVVPAGDSWVAQARVWGDGGGIRPNGKRGEGKQSVGVGCGLPALSLTEDSLE
jgi:hypothetical protein